MTAQSKCTVETFEQDGGTHFALAQREKYDKAIMKKRLHKFVKTCKANQFEASKTLWILRLLAEIRGKHTHFTHLEKLVFTLKILTEQSWMSNVVYPFKVGMADKAHFPKVSLFPTSD